MTHQKLELTWFNKDQALVPSVVGRYGYIWVDPRDPRYCETHTLVLDDYVTGVKAPKEVGVSYSDRADLEPTGDNLLVLGESGDVLEALTRVPEWRDRYVGKVKCVYIDPPFNTGQMFENYEDNLEHSVWLTMMRDRLRHVHRLLCDAGSIWVHLDESESHRMRVLLDEVFGAGNFIADVAWQKTYGPDNRSVFTQMQDSILVYARNHEAFRQARNLLPRSAAQDALYINPDNDPRGRWKPDNFTAQYNPAENPRESQLYTLVTPTGIAYDPPAGACWRYTERKYEELLADHRVWFGPDGRGRPAIKRFLSEVMDGRVPTSWWPYQEVGHTQDAKREVQRIVPAHVPFDTPKPERLLERIIHIATDPGDIVLDCFAGSGTTAAVAQKMGRRWVTCELKESTFTAFTRPRLEKVVRGEDPGGVTVTRGERVPADGINLPDGMEPEDAAKFASLLSKVIKDDPGLKKSPVIKQLRARTRTRKVETVNWRGGGGFQVAHLSPAVFDYDRDLAGVTLTAAAEDPGIFIPAVAAALGFRRTTGGFFNGEDGAQKLFVTRAPLTREYAREIASHLKGTGSVVVAATVVLDGAAEELRRAARGSRVVHVPGSLFASPDISRAVR